MEFKPFALLRQDNSSGRTAFLLFTALQFTFSLIISLLTAAADPLFLGHTPDGLELQLYWRLLGGIEAVPGKINNEMTTLLFFAGSLLMITGGFIYTGRTDRGQKWKKTLLAFGITLLMSLFTLTQLETDNPLPMAYSLIYLWRLCAGIFYLMIFWDNAGLYFDSRSSKKRFPLLALTGTLTYAAGSLLGASSFMTTSPRNSFLMIILLSLTGGYISWLIPRKLKPVTEPRYRKQNWYRECSEGVRYFLQNPYLKALGLATIVFGLTSGVIMFSYNSLVSDRVFSSGSSGRFMAIQRALASTAQTLIFFLMMSQGKTGRGIFRQVMSKFFFLLLGILGFLISTLGVADFSRAVTTALMSPITIASFSLIPSAYRGRALTLNSMVLSAGGMFLSSLLIFTGTQTGWGTPFFLIIILVLLVSRIVMNLFLNRSYMKALSQRLMGTSGQGISDDYLQKILADPDGLDQWFQSMDPSREDQQLLLWSRLAKQASTEQQWKKLRYWAPATNSRAYISWLQICGQCAPAESESLLRSISGLESAQAREALRQLLEQDLFSQEEKAQVKKQLTQKLKNRKIVKLFQHKRDLSTEEPTEMEGERQKELWALYTRFFSDTALEQIEKIYPLMGPEEQYRLISMIRNSVDRKTARFLLKYINPQTFQLMIQMAERWNDWSEEEFNRLLNHRQLKDYRKEILELGLRQKDSKVAHSLKERLKENLSELVECTAEEFISRWFRLRDQKWTGGLYYLLMMRLKRLSAQTGLDPGMIAELRIRFQKLASLLFQYSLPHRQDSLFSPYHKLTNRLFLQEYRICRNWCLLLTLLHRGSSQSRELILDILQNGEQEQQALLLLELGDNLLGKKERKAFGLLLEPLGAQLRRLRLKPFAFEMELKELTGLWKAGLENEGIAGELLGMGSDETKDRARG